MNAPAAKKMQPQGIEEFTSGLQKYIEQRGFREHWVEAQLGMSTRRTFACSPLFVYLSRPVRGFKAKNLPVRNGHAWIISEGTHLRFTFYSL